MRQRTINKISVAEKISIKFSEGSRDNHSVTSEEEALPSFYDSVQLFLPLLIEFAGLDSEYWADGTVTDIVFKYTDSSTAIAISGTCKVKEKYASATSSSFLVFPENEHLLDGLFKEAIAYIDGKRSQQSLDFATAR